MSVETALALVAGTDRFSRGDGYEPTLLPLVVPHLGAREVDAAVLFVAFAGLHFPLLDNPLLSRVAAQLLAERMRLEIPSYFRWRSKEYVRQLPDLVRWIPYEDAARLAEREPSLELALRLAVRGDVDVPRDDFPSALEACESRRGPAEVELLLHLGSDRADVAGIVALVEQRFNRATWLAMLVPYADDPGAMARLALEAITPDYPAWHCTFLAALLAPTAGLEHPIGAHLDLPGPFAAHFDAVLRDAEQLPLVDVPAASHPFGAVLAELLSELSPSEREFVAADVVSGFWGQLRRRGNATAEVAPERPGPIEEIAPERPTGDVVIVEIAPERPYEGGIAEVAPERPGPSVEIAPERPTGDVVIVEIAPERPYEGGIAEAAPERPGPSVEIAPEHPYGDVIVEIAPERPYEGGIAEVAPERPGPSVEIAPEHPYGDVIVEVAPERPADDDNVQGAAERPRVEPRRLVARVFDGSVVVEAVLPPRRELNFAVRVAIPERGDVIADRPAPALPAAPSPTAKLEVVVRGDVWPRQPAPQTISISRVNRGQPSTWAVFSLTTPVSGAVVSIEIVLLYNGKPLQAATYVSPVRAVALPGERPTLTTFALSGPDEPSDELRPVDVTLVGTGAELRREHGVAQVLITDVQAMLDRIEGQVSRVLGVSGAPDSFDDPRAHELLIVLANIGHEFDRLLAPLDIGDAHSINVMVNPQTPVLPLELVYAGPAPLDTAKLCDHVVRPPPPGQACDRTSERRVCPYAFWGLYRSIARTVASEDNEKRLLPALPTFSAASVLYGATVIADKGASDPTPTASVLEAAQRWFPRVTRVTNWRDWRKAITTERPSLLVVLGHSIVEGGYPTLFIGKKSALARPRISESVLQAEGNPRPLVLLIACATAALGDPFGTLPGALTAEGAAAVVGTLSKIIGPHGAAAATHLLHAFHDLAGTGASVGDVVAAARRNLVAERRPIGLVLVSHGEIDTRVV